jgi:NACHT domain
MALLETLTIGVGAAVANSALKLWLKDSEIAAAAATSTVDILAKMLPFEVRRPAQREFDRIADEVGSNLERFLEAECPDLPDNEKEAAALAVARALDRAAITDDLLFAQGLNPLRLERHVLMMIPGGDRNVHAGLYAKILRESCNYVIEITSTLPGFGLRAIKETLQREGEIAQLVKQVLEVMPLSRGAGAGDESDEAFESQYRQNVARELDRLQLFGITTERVSSRYGLSVAYITLSAAQPAAESPESDEDEDASVSSLPVDDALAGSRRVLVRGEAGSGKTTLLQWLAVQSARNAFAGALAPWNGAVPFFIQLRRWVEMGLPQPEQWLTHVASAIRGAMPNGWVHRQLQSGALVLIDGVDELPDSDRARVREWLQALIANAGASRLIITSRPAAAEEGWLREEGFDDSQLQPMEPQQIDALIDQWHVAAHKQATDEDILGNLEGYRDSLKRVIQSDRAIRHLATTPLLCAMLCLLNVDRRTKIPKDRMALYRIALETLARRESERETDRASVLDLTERQRDLALEELAYWLIRNDRSDMKRAEAEGVVADKLPQLADRKKQVVQYLLERSGLLREPVVDRIDFIHRTF